jgi:hypothetical protein
VSLRYIPEDLLKVGTKVITYMSDAECEARLVLDGHLQWVLELDETTYTNPQRIEADTRLTREQLQAALAASGFDTTSEGKDGLSAYLAVYDLTLQSYENQEDKKIRGQLTAEFGQWKPDSTKTLPDWQVGMRMALSCPFAKYPDYKAGLRLLLENLATHSDAYFLFYGDNAYSRMEAQRGPEGLQFFEKFW